MVFVVNTLNGKGKERYKHNAINMLKRSLNLVSLLQTLIYSAFFFFQFTHRHQLPVANQAERKTITSLTKVGIIIMMMMMMMMMMMIMTMTVLIITKFKFDTEKNH